MKTWLQEKMDKYGLETVAVHSMQATGFLASKTISKWIHVHSETFPRRVRASFWQS